MKVNIVIVNYNNSTCTIGLLESLIECTNYVHEVVVVDNCSSKTEVDFLSAVNKMNYGFRVSVINLKENIGYFPGLNVGLDILSNTGEIQTIIGNNDLIFSKSFFEGLDRLNIKEDVLAVAPSIKTIDDVYQNPAQIHKPSLLKRIFYRAYFSNYILGCILLRLWTWIGASAQSNTKKDEQSKNIYIGMGAIYILQPNFFKHYNNLEYPFFLYGEEAFLSKQIENANGVLWYESTIEVIHLESVATSKLPGIAKYKLMKKAYSIYQHYFK